ncbi:NAD(P)H-binding protein [Sporolactobacillus shoreae]|nr:NAD(P)H-binding protein [Sporolactobacillus shoreae]
MKRVLVLGANGHIARIVTDRLLSETNHDLTLYLRRAKRLKHIDKPRMY